MSRALIGLLIALVLWLAPRAAFAHDFRPGVLTLTEREPGRFDVAWAEPVDSTGAPAGVSVIPPSGCQLDGAHLSCAERALSGKLRFEGVRSHRVRIVVVVHWLDGASDEHLVTGALPELSLGDRPAGFAAWLGLGVTHVLGGLDHLGFVIGLMLLVPLSRKLFWTITAFTLAHSLTLCLAALDLLTLPQAPVEAAIAASVVLVAREALTDAPSLTRSRPWLLASLFGLIHGLGFAGALAEIGLPRGAELHALVAFNLGVEVGQIAAVVLVALLSFAGARALQHPPWPRRAACYAIGALGAWWFVTRAFEIVRAAS